MLALTLFVIGNVGVAGSIVFYESLLPHLVERRGAGPRVVGRLRDRLPRRRRAARDQPADDPAARAGSGSPTPATAVRLSLASVGVWWLVFSIPLFRRVPEPRGSSTPASRRQPASLGIGVRRLIATFHELRRYKQAFLLLVAFLIYNDGIQTIIRMATTLRQPASGSIRAR